MKKLTIEQHQRVALRIYDVRKALLSLVTDLAPAKKTVQVKAGKLIAQLDSLRSQLDNELANAPGFNIKTQDFYYNGQ